MSYYSMAYMYETVLGLYDGPKWRNRVVHMSDNQIMAIFYEHLERAERKKKEPKPVKLGEIREEKPEFVPVQLSFFD